MFSDHELYNAMQEFEQNILMVITLSSLPSAIFLLLEQLCWFWIRYKK